MNSLPQYVRFTQLTAEEARRACMTKDQLRTLSYQKSSAAPQINSASVSKSSTPTEPEKPKPDTSETASKTKTTEPESSRKPRGIAPVLEISRHWQKLRTHSALVTTPSAECGTAHPSLLKALALFNLPLSVYLERSLHHKTTDIHMKYAIARAVHFYEGGHNQCSRSRLDVICQLSDRTIDHLFNYAATIDRDECHKILDSLGIIIERSQYAPIPPSNPGNLKRLAPRHTEGNQ